MSAPLPRAIAATAKIAVAIEREHCRCVRTVTVVGSGRAGVVVIDGNYRGCWELAHAVSGERPTPAA